MMISKLKDQYQIILSRDELGTLGNCLTETLEHVEAFEFQTRVGVEPAEVRKLLDQLSQAYRNQ